MEIFENEVYLSNGLDQVKIEFGTLNFDYKTDGHISIGEAFSPRDELLLFGISKVINTKGTLNSQTFNATNAFAITYTEFKNLNNPITAKNENFQIIFVTDKTT